MRKTKKWLQDSNSRFKHLLIKSKHVSFSGSIANENFAKPTLFYKPFLDLFDSLGPFCLNQAVVDSNQNSFEVNSLYQFTNHPAVCIVCKEVWSRGNFLRYWNYIKQKSGCRIIFPDLKSGLNLLVLVAMLRTELFPKREHCWFVSGSLWFRWTLMNIFLWFMKKWSLSNSIFVRVLLEENQKWCIQIVQQNTRRSSVMARFFIRPNDFWIISENNMYVVCS